MTHAEALNVLYEIAKQLTAHSWVVAKEGKLPYSVTLKSSQWGNPNAGGTIEEVLEYYNKHKDICIGVGIILKREHGLVAVDLDHCVNPETGEYSPTAKAVIEHMPDGAYMEHSVSGTGLHILVRGRVDKGISTYPIQPPFDGVKEQVEVFCDRKYIILTGIGKGSIKDGQAFLDWLVSTYSPKPVKPPEPIPIATTARQGGIPPVVIDGVECHATGECVSVDGREYPVYDIPDGDTVEIDGHVLNADGLIYFIDNKINGVYAETWTNLFYGANPGTDDSTNDYRLASLLCYWTKGKITLIRAIMLKSALNRNKYGRKDGYLNSTIKKAVTAWANGECSYYGKHPKRARTKAESNRTKYADYPYLNSKGFPIAGDRENMLVMLNKLGIKVQFNELKQRLLITGADLDGKDLDTQLVLIRDYSVRHGLTSQMNTIGENLHALGHEHKFNPVCEYLLDCWEQAKSSPRTDSPIDELWNRIKLSNPLEGRIMRPYFEKFLLGCIAKAFNTGAEVVDFIPVLKGAQGCGKSTFFRNLIPTKYRDGNPADIWYRDGCTLNTKDRDSLHTVFTVWLCELGELGETLSRSSSDSLKQLLTSSSVVYRGAYARHHRESPNNTMLVATVNDDKFLNDPTGNRRYAVFSVDLIDNGYEPDSTFKPMSDTDINALWGAVMIRAMKNKEQTGQYGQRLNRAEIHELIKLNRRFEKVYSTEQQVLIDMLDWNASPEKWMECTSTDITNLLTDVARHIDSRRMGRALSLLGIEHGITRRILYGRTLWRIPPLRQIKYLSSDRELPF